MTGTMTALVNNGFMERDEDGVWCAHAHLRPGVGAHGEGATPEAAADLREALAGQLRAEREQEA